jgi:hypothetical protein
MQPLVRLRGDEVSGDFFKDSLGIEARNNQVRLFANPRTRIAAINVVGQLLIAALNLFRTCLPPRTIFEAAGMCC